MPLKCSGSAGCPRPVPAELQTEQLCVLHFAHRLEETCNEMRRETAVGITGERLSQVKASIARFGQKLMLVSTGGVPLTDEMKARVLNSFLHLMNLRENLERAAARLAKKQAC